MTAAPERPLRELVEGVPMAEYVASAGINSHGLMDILRSPAHYRTALASEREPTPDMRFGSLVHMAVLETELLAATLVLRPDFDLRTKAGKQGLAEWSDKLPPNAITATLREHTCLMAVLKAMDEHPALRRLMAQGKREATVWWDDPVHSVRCKARYDFVASGTSCIVDVKTARDASPEAFARDAVARQYGLQAAHYLAAARDAGVADPKRFVWVAVEKEPPYGIALYTLTPEEHQRAAGWRAKAMAVYADCLARDEWPGYTRRFTPLEMPRYAPRAWGHDCPDEWF